MEQTNKPNLPEAFRFKVFLHCPVTSCYSSLFPVISLLDPSPAPLGVRREKKERQQTPSLPLFEA